MSSTSYGDVMVVEDDEIDLPIPVQDTSRVILLLDVDCFYAQCKILENPAHLKDKPVGVTQKSLVVTCNYVARGLGVKKMSGIKEAKTICPSLILINGEDL